jgi:hypothetical protein
MDQNSKGKGIFFFGPGSSLKFDFPIRTSKTAPPPPTTDGNECGEKSEDTNNKHENEEKEKEKVSVEAASDEDSDDLLKKIDAVLETENGEYEIGNSRD